MAVLTGVLFARDVTRRYLEKVYGPPVGDFELELTVETYVSYPWGWKAFILAKLRSGDLIVVVKFDEHTKKASLDYYGRKEPTIDDVDGYLSRLGK